MDRQESGISYAPWKTETLAVTGAVETSLEIIEGLLEAIERNPTNLCTTICSTLTYSPRILPLRHLGDSMLKRGIQILRNAIAASILQFGGTDFRCDGKILMVGLPSHVISLLEPQECEILVLQPPGLSETGKKLLQNQIKHLPSGIKRRISKTLSSEIQALQHGLSIADTLIVDCWGADEDYIYLPEYLAGIVSHAFGQKRIVLTLSSLQQGNHWLEGMRMPRGYFSEVIKDWV